jgi:proton-coupled amino acid transporter
MENGPKRLKKLSRFSRNFMDTAMFLNFLSGCVYFIFVAATFQELLNHAFKIDWNLRTFILLTFVPVLMIGQIRELKHLVPFSMIANFLILGAFVITIYYIFEHPLEFSDKPLIVSAENWPNAVSMILFAVTNIRNAMSIENGMQEPQKYLGIFGVLNVTSYIVASFYALIGFFSYVRYGDAIKGSVTLNLPVDEPLALTAKVFIGIAVLFSFGLIFHVCMEILWTRFGGKIKQSRKNIFHIAARTIIAILMVGLAILIPNLKLFISLVGTVIFGTLSVFIPVLTHTIFLVDKSYGKFRWKLIVNLFLIFLYFVILVSSTCDDVKAIIEIYQ